MGENFEELPSGEESLSHIREMVDYIRDRPFGLAAWKPRPALRERSSGRITHLFVGQRYDPRFFELEPEGWTHDHCLICQGILMLGMHGYSDGTDWVCIACFDHWCKGE